MLYQIIAVVEVIDTNNKKTMKTFINTYEAEIFANNQINLGNEVSYYARRGDDDFGEYCLFEYNDNDWIVGDYNCSIIPPTEEELFICDLLDKGIFKVSIATKNNNEAENKSEK